MSSVSSQPQFRYTQPPSKVLHLRNLPWECTEEELIELGKPFGKVVNTKCNVGANRNQAFIEFEETNQAIAMISYHASSSEPAQVRGKTVYLQYSNRQEIVNNKTTADVAGNVLLVTIEGNDARLVSIDVLHLVFSAFGFVHKITTFEKTAGFQALVQFSDSQTAAAAKDALDGRSIPSYLIPDLGPCALRITYSAHTDLSVKFQSHRSRDYTNPLLPVAPSAIDASGQFSLGVDGKKLEPESNVLLASIENMQYAVTLDVLQTVFSAFGPVLKIAMFDKNGGLQALIQYPETRTRPKRAASGKEVECSFTKRNFFIYLIFFLPFTFFLSPNKKTKKCVIQKSKVLIRTWEKVDIGAVQVSWILFLDVQTAVVAKEALEGHCIYDGGYCKLHISYSRHTDLSIKVNNDRSRDYTIPNTPVLNSQTSILGQQQYPVRGPATQAYNGAQYAPAHDPHTVPPLPSTGWNPTGHAIPQSMPMQMHNYPYGAPGGPPPAMGRGMMPSHGQNGLPPSSQMPPYHPQ